MSSGSVSASFPYIPMAGTKVDDGKWHPKASSSVGSVKPCHARLGSLSSSRPQPSPRQKAAAEKLCLAMILRQSAAKGVHLADGDVFAENAPWRTDETLASPDMWKAYEAYPQVTELMLKYGDPSKSTPAELDELERYLSLSRFGETEQNIWRIFRRIVGQKKKARVSAHRETETTA